MKEVGKETNNSTEEKKEEKNEHIHTKANREYLKIIKSQAILMMIFLGATLMELIFIMFNQENFDYKMNIILAVFAGVAICYVGQVVYLRPVLELFRKIRLDEEYKERIETAKIRKTSIALLFYRVGTVIVLGGMIYVIVTNFITLG